MVTVTVNIKLKIIYFEGHNEFRYSGVLYNLDRHFNVYETLRRWFPEIFQVYFHDYIWKLMEYTMQSRGGSRNSSRGGGGSGPEFFKGGGG